MVIYPYKNNGLTDEEKIAKIQKNFSEIMETLGLDLEDDSLSKTPYRVAKMYVKEIFKGLNEKDGPDITTFENKMEHNQMVVVKNIKVMSSCEHHFLPFIGEAFIAYIPKDKIIGLSKINRLVDFCARKPQIQERLVEEIYLKLKEALGTRDIAVVIKANHYCVIMRGIEDINSETITSKVGGIFIQNDQTRSEFLTLIGINKN